MSDVIVGFDFGSTRSVLAISDSNKGHVAENPIVCFTTPSVVAFSGERILVGEASFSEADGLPAVQVIHDSKRLIGRALNDKKIAHIIQNRPIGSENGTDPMYIVQYKQEKRLFSPAQIASFILRHLKTFAEKERSVEITEAVIAVPAYFNDAQRRATVLAGELAGLQLVRLVSEPIAAAVACGALDRAGDQKLLVYDFGGDSFNVAIVEVTAKEISVLSHSHDPHLGGSTLDDILITHFCKKFRAHFARDFETMNLEQLRHECVALKHNLSTQPTASFTMKSLVDGHDFTAGITRALFESLCQEKLSRTVEHVRAVLKSAKLKTDDIDDVLLVGGSSRIPKVKELFVELFPGKIASSDINPEEVIARGACHMAAQLADSQPIGFVQLETCQGSRRLVDITPLPPGLELLSRGVELQWKDPQGASGLPHDKTLHVLRPCTQLPHKPLPSRTNETGQGDDMDDYVFV